MYGLLLYEWFRYGLLLDEATYGFRGGETLEPRSPDAGSPVGREAVGGGGSGARFTVGGGCGGPAEEIGSGMTVSRSVVPAAINLAAAVVRCTWEPPYWVSSGP